MTCPVCGYGDGPVLVDLFSGAGGAGWGYHLAGFHVVGVDNRPMPRYPLCFVQADALTFPLDGFDAIHASPVCLTFARVTDWRGSREDHPDTLTPTLAKLERITVPWVVENVEEAGLRADFLLCGSQFGLSVKRHRHFQIGNWASYNLMPPCDHRKLLPFTHKGERAFADAMGCTWMTKLEARQAIPPAYTEYIGGYLLESIPDGRPTAAST